jgi:hypothetical protein
MIMTMRYFEVHKYVGGKWELAALCEDKESALGEARLMVDSSRNPVGVRVLRVVSREDKTGDVTFDEQTIFRQSPVEADSNAGLARAWEEVEAAREKRRLERLRARAAAGAAAEDPSNRRLKLILALTIGAWIATVVVIVFHQYVL